MIGVPIRDLKSSINPVFDEPQNNSSKSLTLIGLRYR